MKTPDTTPQNNETLNQAPAAVESKPISPEADAIYRAPTAPEKSQEELANIQKALERVQTAPQTTAVSKPFSATNELAEYQINKSFAEVEEKKAEQSVSAAKTLFGVSLAGTTLGTGLGIGALVAGVTAAAPIAFTVAGVGAIAMAGSALYKKIAEKKFFTASEKLAEVS